MIVVKFAYHPAYFTDSFILAMFTQSILKHSESFNSSIIQPLLCEHVHAYLYILTHPHKCTLTCMHIRMHAHAHTHARTHTHIQTDTQIYTNMHAHTHSA